MALMLAFLHGAAGGWDEVAIAVAALAVLWVAVKLAGRKGANDDEEDEEESLSEEIGSPETEERRDPERSSPTTRG
jgi:hypothetical protein